MVFALHRTRTSHVKCELSSRSAPESQQTSCISFIGEDWDLLRKYEINEPVQEVIPRKMTFQTLLGDVPSPAERLMEELAERLGIDHNYHRRNLILTENALCLTTSDETPIVKDSIPLVEIVKISEKQVSLPIAEFSVEGAVQQKTQKRMHFEISTASSTKNMELTYIFATTSRESQKLWIQTIGAACTKAYAQRSLQLRISRMDWYRKAVKRFYDSTPIQIFVALLVFLNFLATAAQSEVQPLPGSYADQIFATMDVVFTSLFAVELALNMVANWFYAFWKDGWNLFDLLVVSVSLVGLAVQNLPAVSTLRLLRAFRVMRLFGRLRSLRCIVNSLTASIAPVCNAFLIMLLVTSVYAILGTTFFEGVTEEYFGSFSLSMFTLFQVTFFASFIVIVGWTLLQVVVAVLLESFSAAASKEAAKALQAKAEEAGHEAIHLSTDPLMASLAHFETDSDLSQRIAVLFKVLDSDDSGSISLEELQTGLRKLHFTPRVCLSADDLDAFTAGGALCDAGGGTELHLEGFELVIRRQLAAYVQRQVASALSLAPAHCPRQTGTVLAVLKLIRNGLEHLSPDIALPPSAAGNIAGHHTPHNGNHTSHNGNHTSHNGNHTSHNGNHTSHNGNHTSHNGHHTSHNGNHTSHNGNHTSHNGNHASHNGFAAHGLDSAGIAAGRAGRNANSKTEVESGRGKACAGIAEPSCGPLEEEAESMEMLQASIWSQVSGLQKSMHMLLQKLDVDVKESDGPLAACNGFTRGDDDPGGAPPRPSDRTGFLGRESPSEPDGGWKRRLFPNGSSDDSSGGGISGALRRTYQGLTYDLLHANTAGAPGSHDGRARRALTPRGGGTNSQRGEGSGASCAPPGWMTHPGHRRMCSDASSVELRRRLPHFEEWRQGQARSHHDVAVENGARPAEHVAGSSWRVQDDAGRWLRSGRAAGSAFGLSCTGKAQQEDDWDATHWQCRAPGPSQDEADNLNPDSDMDLARARERSDSRGGAWQKKTRIGDSHGAKLQVSNVRVVVDSELPGISPGLSGATGLERSQSRAGSASADSSSESESVQVTFDA